MDGLHQALGKPVDVEHAVPLRRFGGLEQVKAQRAQAMRLQLRGHAGVAWAVAGAAAAVCEQHQALGPWRQRELALQARGPDVHDFRPGLHGRGQQHPIPLLPIERDGVG